jgi:hypothetical protein
MRKNLLIVVFCLLSGIAVGEAPVHPRLYATETDRPAILDKIKNTTWGAESWAALLHEIDSLVERHQTDPQWILSRMAMYWENGAHYTQCYLKNEHWNSGVGNAPIPTVRLPGMRIWNDYKNVPLAERIPYNETGDMLATSSKDPSQPPVLVPYRESGHLIRDNNKEILGLAEKAAFAWYLTGEEKYGAFAGDIFYQWLLGTYYMNPPFDPTSIKDGWQPGGILGYYDFEVIHDDLPFFSATTYDFLYHWLKQHPNNALEATGKSLDEVANEVFRRFIEINRIRGGKSSNWNTNGFNVCMRAILVLEDNAFFPDGKGRSYYLNNYTTESTKYHDALPDILKGFNSVTGLWSESPGYSTGTIQCLLDMAMPIYKNGVNTFAGNDDLEKDAMAILEWLDARGNQVIFGDSRGGSVDFGIFENLFCYYTWTDNIIKSLKVASVLRQGLKLGSYSRNNVGWEGLCLYIPELPETANLDYARVAYSPEHRHLIQRNLNDPEDGMMFTLYGGTRGKHLSANGLAWQFYGKGWAMAPDASAYESYWTADHTYHQGICGVNTVIPGYTEGPIQIENMDPMPSANSLIGKDAISDFVSFAEVTAAEKRRMVVMVRTSPTTGYYVDMFRSDLETNDYLHHNLGDSLHLMDHSGNALNLTPVESFGFVPVEEYSFFKNIRKTTFTDEFRAVWTVSEVKPALCTQLWMNGAEGRTLFAVDAPSTTLNDRITPGGVCRSPQPTPTLIVRQENNNAKTKPFAAVFEVYNEGAASVTDVKTIENDSTYTVVQVESKGLNNRFEVIGFSLGPELRMPVVGMMFSGRMAVVSEDASGVNYLYLAKGIRLEYKGYVIEAVNEPVTAELRCKNGVWSQTSDHPVRITKPEVSN